MRLSVVRNQYIENMFQVVIFVFMLCQIITSITYANNSYFLGKTYQVAEKNFLNFIKEKLMVWEKKGKLMEYKMKLMSLAKERFETPVTINEIPTTINVRKYYYDPSYRLKKDIVGANNEVVFAKNTVINPLDYINLNETLVFINAKDEGQLCWAKKIKTQKHIKVILVSGNINTAIKWLNQNVYFDQFSLLSEKLKIKHVPAIVVQENRKLKIIEELPC